MAISELKSIRPNIEFYEERVDLAAAFRWTEKLNWHEGVANHFSLAVNDDGTQFLMNPKNRHFSRIKASDMLLLDSNNPPAADHPDAPDPTAWGLHGSIHRHCQHARCVLHVHSIYATVLASLADSTLPPIDQNTATFYNRYIIDENYGGLAFEEEGERCAAMLSDPKKKVLIMGNHGVLVMGASVADAFNRLYYFEKSAETYIKALQTGRPLRVLSDEIASKTADELEAYPGQEDSHFNELKAILDDEKSNYTH
ncbi:MAG: class II aldolase/adducin family protein [Alphaproteobacteria bacterium]|nr:class II aldolase/adducin family protein [Alphaproteobacteria bacterium]